MIYITISNIIRSYVCPVLGICVWFLFCYVVIGVLSVGFCSRLAGKERAGWFLLTVLLLLRVCVSLSRGAVGWSVIVAFPGDTYLIYLCIKSSKE